MSSIVHISFNIFRFNGTKHIFVESSISFTLLSSKLVLFISPLYAGVCEISGCKNKSALSGKDGRIPINFARNLIIRIKLVTHATKGESSVYNSPSLFLKLSKSLTNVE
ncbi:hypothetical protein QTN25_005590 [Entamoeba marina]